MAGVDPDEAARIEHALDRLDDRLVGAPPGLHRVGGPASASACAEAGLSPAAAMLWTRWDGLEVGGEMARVLPVAEMGPATEAADAQGLLRPGDRVMGEVGRDLLVLPEDPWAEGADVVLIEEGGERLPEASSAAHLALGLVGEASVVFGDDGEFRDGLFGEDGDPTEATRRKVLRRRLDLDPDAPRPRLRLAQRLLAAGELRGAASELVAVLKRAPELPWAHETLGRIHEAQGDLEQARRAYQAAAEPMASIDTAAAAYFLARAARCAQGPQQEEIAARVRAQRPTFAREQVDAARALLERDARADAREVVAVGLAVSPAQVELLALREQIERGESG